MAKPPRARGGGTWDGAGPPGTAGVAKRAFGRASRREDDNKLESLIMAQDERWRRA